MHWATVTWFRMDVYKNHNNLSISHNTLCFLCSKKYIKQSVLYVIKYCYYSYIQIVNSNFFFMRRKKFRSTSAMSYTSIKPQFSCLLMTFYAEWPHLASSWHRHNSPLAHPHRFLTKSILYFGSTSKMDRDSASWQAQAVECGQTRSVRKGWIL